MAEQIRPDGVSLLDAAVLLAELVLLGLLAVSGWRLGADQPWQTLLAVALPLVLASGWGLWLAPNAMMRLRFPVRLVVKVDLFIAGAVLLTISGLVLWGVVFGVVSVVIVIAGELADHRRQTRYFTRG